MRQERPTIEQVYYGVELGMYVNMLAKELTSPPGEKAKDHKVMIVHHVVTLGLLLASAYFRAFSMGCLILFVHDLSDPFLEVGQFSNQTDKPPAILLI
jgi:ceramide synthetase